MSLESKAIMSWAPKSEACSLELTSNTCISREARLEVSFGFKGTGHAAELKAIVLVSPMKI